MSAPTQCPHCPKKFLQLKQHITKTHEHHRFEIPTGDVPNKIRYILTRPDGSKRTQECAFEFVNEDGKCIYECYPYNIGWCPNTRTIYMVGARTHKWDGKYEIARV